MALDPVRNFAKVTVSQGYNSSATQITLVTGDGAKLPDPATEGAFNLVWYNDTDYKDPADDPYVEIVRVTAKSGDTLTIQRGQEGTSAQNHNLSGKTYKMVLAMTKKMKDDIESLGPVNKGKAWIAHGNNVITFSKEHSSNNYRWIVSLVQAPMGGITPRNVRHTAGLTVFISNESATRGKVRIEGGYGFTSCGYTSTYVGTTERFDDVANTHTARANATARSYLAGYSLNGYGFTSCGNTGTNVGTTERFDDVANTHTARADASARDYLTGYSLNGYGFTSCGYTSTYVGTTERFDDVANTHTARANASARASLTGYSLNNYGFTSCGETSGGSKVGTTERFDDVVNIHTARANATAREYLAGYSLNGYGFTSCGTTGTTVGTTERFDDVTNTHTARANATARIFLTGYSLNGYGFTSCGYTTTLVGTTERFDDVANIHTARADATARRYLTGYSTNEYFVNYLTFNE
jgi:hypothetical protein